MTCDDLQSRLSFHAEGLLPAGESAEVEAHLAACAGCREALEDARALGTRLRRLPLPKAPALAAEPRPALPAVGRGPWAWAAAAALLVAAGGWTWFSHAPGGRPESTPPVVPGLVHAAPVSAPGSYAVGREGLALSLPDGNRLACAPGTRLSLPAEPGAPVKLEDGALWAQVERPLALRTPAGTLVLESGDAALRIQARPSPSSAWRLLLGEARAEETRPAAGVMELLLLDGSSARLGSARWSGPCRVLVPADGKPSVGPVLEADLAEALAWRDAAEAAGEWHNLASASTLGTPSPEGKSLLEHLPAEASAIVLEAEVRAPAGSQVALCYPSGNRSSATTLGSGALSPRTWQVLRARVSGGRVEIFADGRRIACVKSHAGNVGEAALAADFPATGLKVWQGPVEIRRLRWRTLREMRQPL